MSEKTVSSMVVRLVLDSTEEILGTNGLKSLLNYAGLIAFFENKPDYTLEKNYTDEDYGRLTSSWYKVLGTSGGKAVFRVIGKTIAKQSIASGVFESIKDLPSDEKLLKMIEIYRLATGRGTVTKEGNTIVYDNPQCSACKDVTSDTPICVGLSGSFDEYAAWAGATGVKTVETKCKAKGEASCRFEIVLT